MNSITRNHIKSDFEIYYYSNHTDKYIGEFPCIWLIDTNRQIIYHSVGLKEYYGHLKDKIETYVKHKCLWCNGTGRISPIRHGDPDESAGIYPLCGGKER